MPFRSDQQLAVDVGGAYGAYLITFIRKRGQVRADLFRRGEFVEAHVSFPTGLDAGNVTDPYVSDLWDYAREQGFQDQFRVILSAKSSTVARSYA